MKNELSTITSNGKSRGASVINWPKILEKQIFRQRKIMLSIWWDWKGIVSFELLSRTETISSSVYCRQLDELSSAIRQQHPELVNCKGIVFLNGRSHTSLKARQKLLQLGWDVLPYPSYKSLRLFSIKFFHLFRSLQNSLRGRIFNSNDIKQYLDQFFAAKD